MSNLRSGEEPIADTDFVPVNVTLSESLSLTETGQPRSRVNLEISVSERDFSSMLDFGSRVPVITFKTNNDALADRVFGETETFELNSVRQDFVDRSPALLEFPIKRTPGQLIVEFGDGEGRIVLPFAIAN